MHLRVLLAVILLAAGGYGAFASDPILTQASEDPVEATLSWRDASVRGDLTPFAPRGSILVTGTAASLLLQAESLALEVVHVEKEYVENPLGNETTVTREVRRDRHFLREGQVELLSSRPESILYAYVENADGGTFRAPLGEVAGQPFAARFEQSPFIVLEQGQPYAFEHIALPPLFTLLSPRAGAGFRAAMPEIGIDGTFRLVADHAILLARNASSELRIETGAQSSEETSVGPLMPRYVGERTYAVLTARNASLLLRPGPADAQLLMGEPTYRLNGTLVAPATNGTVRSGSASMPLSQDTVEITGELLIRPRAETGEANVLDLGGRDEPIRATVIGEGREVRVNGEAVLLPLDLPGVRTASLLVVLVGLVALSWGWIKAAFASLLLPLYARLLPAELLSNTTRQAIYSCIGEKPFVHMRELTRRTGFSHGTVAYHLHVLRKERFVSCVKDGRRTHFFHVVLANPTRARIARSIVDAPGRTQEALAAEFALDRASLSRHLKRLDQAQLLRTVGRRDRKYHPAPLLAAWLGSPRLRPQEQLVAAGAS